MASPSLADLHRAGAIHRDVSPENIVLSPERGAVLIDFNALGALTERNRLGRTTIVGEFAGKGFYMAASMTEPDVEAAPPAFRSVLAQLLSVDPGNCPDAGEAARLIFAAADPLDEPVARRILDEKDTGKSQRIIRRNRPPRVHLDYPQPSPLAPAPGTAAAKGGRAGGGWLLTLAAVLLCAVGPLKKSGTADSIAWRRAGGNDRCWVRRSEDS